MLVSGIASAAFILLKHGLHTLPCVQNGNEHTEIIIICREILLSMTGLLKCETKSS